jgi:glutamyl-tRNA synthetase
VHIGNIRTAIFNWLFARHCGGSFLLRIEDTDLERSTRQAIDALLQCMAWLDLNFDGEIMYQASQKEAHIKAAGQMIAKGLAYAAPAPEGGQSPVFFRIPWNCPDFTAIREAGPAELNLHPETPVKIDFTGVSFSAVSKKGAPMPAAACLAGFRQMKLYDETGNVIFELEENIDGLLHGKQSFSLDNCVKMTFLRREIFYKDIIKGELSKPLDGIKDLIIVRSDGSPVFHLANVVDDITQNVTHIIRGDDHVENTYRHIMLFYALGRKAPEYAHLPMIVNSSGKPYSKRDGDAFVGDFREKGFLAEALFNYLALLGWSPGGDREKMTKQEMIEAFTLERVKSAPAQLDSNKLLNMNGTYIAEMPFEKFVDYAGNFAGDFVNDKARFEQVARLMQSRVKQFGQVATWKYFFSDDFPVDEKVFKKQLASAEVRAALGFLAGELNSRGELTKEWLHIIISKTEERFGIPHGRLFQPLRLAVSGVAGGAELDETIMLIGGSRSAARITRSLEVYQKEASHGKQI